MKHLTVVLLLMSIVSGLSYFVLTHPSRQEAERLRGDLARIQEKNQAVKQENTLLERQVVALRDDPRLAERRARESAGLARPGELIYQFEAPRRRAGVTVELRASADGVLRLAGETTAAAELPKRLKALHQALPDARLKVFIHAEINPLERQRIEDLLQASPVPLAEVAEITPAPKPASKAAPSAPAQTKPKTTATP